MSNVKHPKCALRTLAVEAKKRLSANGYCEPAAPKYVTPQQKQIYLKLVELERKGEEVVNPVVQFADKNKLNSLSHEEKQRYILQLCADYISMRSELERKNHGQ